MIAPVMFRFCGYTLDVGRGSLWFGEREVELRPKTFALLRHLVENADRLVTKDELINAIWPNVVVADESLTHCVSEVRRAIGDRDQTIIRTISRRGYRLAAPVSRLVKSGALQPSQTPKIGSRLLTSSDVHLPDEPAVFGRPAIAVLAFLNLSADPAQECVSDGVAEDIITELSRFSELSVVARNSSFQYKGKAVDARQIGRELGARYVVEGSVRRERDRLRITVQLIDAMTGVHRWAERYDREVGAAFAVQDEITRAIVSTLAAHVRKAEAERGLLKAPSVARNAYDYFLLGVQAYRAHLLDPASVPIGEARNLLQQSLTADPDQAHNPDHAHAYAWLARTRVRTFWDPVDRDYLSPAGIDQSYELARKAVLLDPNLPLGHFQLGLAQLFRRRQDEALAEFDRTFALNRNDNDYQFGFGLVLAGQSARAIDVLQTNIDLDPFGWPIPHLYLGQACYMLEHYSRALAPLGRYAAGITGPGLCIVSAFLAATHAQLGRPKEAKAALTEALRVNPSITVEKMVRALPYNDRRDVAHLADGLSKAGLPIA